MKSKHKLYRYYSQYGEDFILWNFFEYKENGFFIDIGAFDGIHLSNSYTFEEQGWKGICVEPVSKYFELCKKNRPKSICINAACISSGELKEIELEVDDTGLFSSLHIDKTAKNVSGHFDSLKRTISIKKEKVKAVTLNSVLQNLNNDPNEIDFISIDVEGAEIEVLKGFDLDKYIPRIIVIETNTLEDKEHIKNYLSQFGYLFAREVRANSYFVKNESDLNKVNSIDITCTIEKQLHPLGEDYTINDYKTGIFYYKGEKGHILLKSLNAKLNSANELLNKRNEHISITAKIQKQKDELLIQKDEQLKYADVQLTAKNQEIKQKEDQLNVLKAKANQLNINLKEFEIIVKEKDKQLEQQADQLEHLEKLMHQKDNLVSQQIEILKQRDAQLIEQDKRLIQYNILLKQNDDLIKKQSENLIRSDSKILLQEEQIKQYNILEKQKDELIKQQLEIIQKNAEQLFEKDDVLKKYKNLTKQRDQEIKQKINELTVFYNSYTYKIIRLILWPSRFLRSIKK
ncbi:MAG: hypothetical protein CVU00_14935 [Bacteroidetes bacterium HGW-Bacteroidetes-17]|jgi:FkbM family methyltransferase|nr:MAG: hypothetical protein CVU00_14935 [Bacteroidetes bacterium HGW-Bacteroidetes-17]